MVKLNIFKVGVLACGLSLFLFSCDNDTADEQSEAQEEIVDEGAEIESDEKGEISDAAIAHIAVTANQVDIEFAKVAKEKSDNEMVIKFADLMADDHGNVIDVAVELADKLGVVPEDK